MTMKQTFASAVIDLHKSWTFWCRLFDPDPATGVPQGPPLPEPMVQACEFFFAEAKTAMLHDILDRLKLLLLGGPDVTYTARGVFEVSRPRREADDKTSAALDKAEEMMRVDLSDPLARCLSPCLQRNLVEKVVRILVDFQEQELAGEAPPRGTPNGSYWIARGTRADWEVSADGFLRKLASLEERPVQSNGDRRQDDPAR